MYKYHELTMGGGLRPLVTGELHKRGAAYEGAHKCHERDGAPGAE